MQVELSQHYQGPIPSPEMFAEYERALPGSADRILGMAEAQSKHRMQMESQVVVGNLKSQNVGQWMAFVVVLGGMGLGAWFITHGYDTAGFTAMLTPLGGVAGIFVWGRFRQEKERQRKLEQTTGQGREE